MKTTFAALAFAVTAAAAAPAMAGGTMTFGYSAKNQEEARWMRAGMAAYTLVDDYKKNGKVTKNGANTAASFVTYGNNAGAIHQNGNGHNGSMVMGGHDTKCMLIQEGNGANNHVNAGGGQTCIVVGVGFK